MGRGDKRTFRGKLFKGSHGNTRRRKAAKKKAPAKKS
jgi:ribosomal small subunit protein bTHX